MVLCVLTGTKTKSKYCLLSTAEKGLSTVLVYDSELRQYCPVGGLGQCLGSGGILRNTTITTLSESYELSMMTPQLMAGRFIRNSKTATVIV